MNWHKKILLKTAAATSKIKRYNIASPAIKFFIHKYESMIPWNEVEGAKKANKTPEDVINEFISSKLIPSLSKKIDPRSDDNNYIKHYDVQARYDAAVAIHRENPDQPVPADVELAYQIYQRDPEGAEQKLMGIINTDKKARFLEWWNYLSGEEAYQKNPAFQFSVLKPVIDSSPEKTEVAPLPMNPEAVSLIWDEISEHNVTQMNVLKKYRKISNELNEQGVETVETGEEGNKWINIPSKIKDPDNYQVNKARLQSFSQGTKWCIAGETMSNLYLSDGDFWLYLEGGRAVVAIRLDKNEKVLEIRGHQYPDTSGIPKLKPYWKEVTDFLHKSELDYRKNEQYKVVEEIWMMNQDLEKGSPSYNEVIKRIQEDHTAYLQLSEENRQKFPEFLEIAKQGYRAEFEQQLQNMEKPGLSEAQYFTAFETFQDYYKNIPQEIKTTLGDLQPRIFEAHRKAFKNNPYLFPSFPPEIQTQFSPEEQIGAWQGYVQDDPYHYNDGRMPDEIKQMLKGNLKNAWMNMLRKNALHLDYMSQEVVDLFTPQELGTIALEDFAKFPVSQRHFGSFDKLERVEKFMNMGIVTREQIVEVFRQAVNVHPEWVDIIPDNYKNDILGGRNVTEMGGVMREKAMRSINDPGYFRVLPPDVQDALLGTYGADIGAAFAKESSKYRGMLHNFYISVPERVRPHLPPDVIDAVALFYANILNGNPSNFDETFSKIPPEMQGQVWGKLAQRKSWFKEAQQKEITINDIIWAIDKIVAEKYEFSVEELLQTSNQQWQSKAAQAVKTRKKQKGYPRSLNTRSIPGKNKSLEKKILRLFNQAISPGGIASQLGISTPEVTKILKQHFPSKKDQIDYLVKQHEQNILDFTQNRAEEMRNDFNIYAITIEDISRELNINPKFVKTIIQNNKIDLKKLSVERRDRIAEAVVEIVKGFNRQPKIREVMDLFFQKHNFKLSQRSAFSAMKLRNVGTKTQNDPSTILKALTTFIHNTVSGGIKSLAERPENIPLIIDRFFINYGEYHGFAPPINKEVLKNMFMKKIQLRERTEENMMNRNNPNRYAPIVTDETHPSYFLNQEAKAMNWYKKARKGIPGGLADKKKPSDFSQKELEMGVGVEMEHTNDKELSKDISMDHLEEFPNYYTELDRMEKKLEEKKPAQNRGLYNQPQNDSYNQQAGEEVLNDWEFANKEELSRFKALAQQHRFEDMRDYGEQLVQSGYARMLVEKLMTAAMYKVKL